MVTIIDSGIVNVGSVQNMLLKLGASSTITNNKEDIHKSKKIILPGIGHFDKAMSIFESLDLIETLNYKVLEEKTPILGICLGMQLFTKRSDEGKKQGFGWLDAETLKFKDNELRIPHMGWNTVKCTQTKSIIDNKLEESRYYFVHSYYVKCKHREDVMGVTHYGEDFHSAVCKGNIMGTQFHPEKSHKFGMDVFRKFLNL